MRQPRALIAKISFHGSGLSLAPIVASVAFFACTDSNFSGNSNSGRKSSQGNGLRQGNPIDPNSKPDGGRPDSSEDADTTVTELKLNGTWGFDGCGKVVFDLTTGKITVSNVGTAKFFNNKLTFSFKRQDGSSANIEVDGRVTIPDWKPACVKTQVQAPQGIPISRPLPALPVAVNGGQPGSKVVEYTFDDDGGDNTTCASKGRELPGAVNVDASSFKIELTQCK